MAGMKTVLSIDSGGVQGIIPATILEYLEAQLQDLDGPDARVVDYFDMIAGTGSGAYTASLISTPARNGKPIAAKEIVPLYKTEFPQVFPQPRQCSGAPAYKNKKFNELVQKRFGTDRLSTALTKVVITSFDSFMLRPLNFTTETAKIDSTMDVLISDACIASFAAFPWVYSYEFNNKGQNFNTLDGSVATANPALLAVTDCIRDATEEDTKIKRLLVISLGACSARGVGWTAETLNSFNSMDQMLTQSLPMIERFTYTVNSFMADYVLEDIFRTYNSEDNYIRISDDDLTKEMDTIDLATPANMDNLERHAKKLLQKPVTRAGLDPTDPRVTSKPEETYAQALQRLAISLSDYKNLRQK